MPHSCVVFQLSVSMYLTAGRSSKFKGRAHLARSVTRSVSMCPGLCLCLRLCLCVGFVRLRKLAVRHGVGPSKQSKGGASCWEGRLGMVLKGNPERKPLIWSALVCWTPTSCPNGEGGEFGFLSVWCVCVFPLIHGLFLIDSSSCKASLSQDHLQDHGTPAVPGRFFCRIRNGFSKTPG